MDSEAIDGVLFYRGAEADLFLSRLGPWNTVIKQRVRKSYRTTELDGRIRRERTIREALALHEAKRAGTRAPVVLSLDAEKHSIVMTRVEGTPARDGLDRMGLRASQLVFRELGRQVALLHQGGIVHGDLTTSNIVIAQGNLPFILDFGMSSYSSEAEDRGVDLHLLKRSIATSHAIDAESCSKAVWLGYREVLGPTEASKSFRKTREIARRGRYFALR